MLLVRKLLVIGSAMLICLTSLSCMQSDEAGNEKEFGTSADGRIQVEIDGMPIIITSGFLDPYYSEGFQFTQQDLLSIEALLENRRNQLPAQLAESYAVMRFLGLNNVQSINALSFSKQFDISSVEETEDTYHLTIMNQHVSTAKCEELPEVFVTDTSLLQFEEKQRALLSIRLDALLNEMWVKYLEEVLSVESRVIDCQVLLEDYYTMEGRAVKMVTFDLSGKKVNLGIPVCESERGRVEVHLLVW